VACRAFVLLVLVAVMPLHVPRTLLLQAGRVCFQQCVAPLLDVYSLTCIPCSPQASDFTIRCVSIEICVGVDLHAKYADFLFRGVTGLDTARHVLSYVSSAA